MNRTVCLSGLMLCLLVGGYLRFAGYDWGYDRDPIGPFDAQAGYTHPDERSVYSKTSALRWDAHPRAEQESWLGWQWRTVRRNLTHENSGMNLRSFNYGSFPYYVLFAWSHAANTWSVKSVRISLLGFLLGALLIFWILRFVQRRRRKLPPRKWVACLLELAGVLLVWGILAWQAGKVFRNGINPEWGYGSWALLGRPISALAGTLTIFYVYRLGARLYRRQTGLLAAIFFSFAVLNIQLSHFFTFDVIVAFFTTAAVYSLVVFSDAQTWRARWRALIAASLWTGLAFATKFSSILLFIPWAVSLWIVYWRHRPHCRWYSWRSVGMGLHLKILGLVSFGLIWFTAFLGQPFGYLNYPQGAAYPEWSFIHLAIDQSAAPSTSKFGQMLSATARSLNPITRKVGIHLTALPYPDHPGHFPDLLAIGSSKYWKDVVEQREMAVTGSNVPWTRQYNHTTPFVYQWQTLILYGLGIPLGLVCLGGLLWGFARPFWRPGWGELVVWWWMLPNFLSTHLFHTKFPRYQAPLLPFFCLWGAAGLLVFYHWCRTSPVRSRQLLARAVVAIALVTMAWSLLYSFAFVKIYQQPHVWSQASQWFREEVPEGRKIITENWDDAVPWDGRVASRYRTITVNPIHSDAVTNMENIARNMAQADYYCFSSKRNYGAILQSPEESPNRSNFYRSLFAGQLGYQLVKTFSQPVRVWGIPIHFELADESLSLYDHPTVHIFERTQRLTADNILDKILNPPHWVTQITREQVLTATEHRSILAPPAPYALYLWLLGVVVLGWLVWPISFALFRYCPDGGILASKMVGLVLLTFLGWFGSSCGWWPNQRWALWLSALILTMVSAACLYRQRNRCWAFLRSNWHLVVISELLFVLVFAYFGWIRTSNPDIHWGEKPMDISFVAAANRAPAFPAEDPWYAGTTVNYYYYGHIMVGLFGKWVGVAPEYAYNLAAATWPAMLFVVVFGLVYNLMRSWLGALLAGFFAAMAGNTKAYLQLAANLRLPSGPADPRSGFRDGYVPHDGWYGYLQDMIDQIQQAVAALPAVFSKVSLAARAAWNPDLAEQAEAAGLPHLLSFDSYLWKLSRIIKSTVACEFPAWSATFADLHAHLLVMPVGALFVSLVVAYCQRKQRRWELHAAGEYGLACWETGGRATGAMQLGMLGLLLGVVSVTNTWDLPGWLLLFAGLAVLLFVAYHRELFQSQRWTTGRSIARLRLWGRKTRRLAWWKLSFLQEVVFPVALVALLSRAALYPFHLSFEAPERVKGAAWMHSVASGWTTPYELIQTFGWYLLILLVGLGVLYWRWITRWRGGWWKTLLVGVLGLGGTYGVVRGLRHLARGVFDPAALNKIPSPRQDIAYWQYLDADLAYLSAGFLGLVLLGYLALVVRRRASLADRLGGGILVMGLSILVGCELLYIREGWGPPNHRWNTVFKFHLQAWICLAIGSGWLISTFLRKPPCLAGLCGRWLGRFFRYLVGYPVLVAAVLLASVFPLVAPYLFSRGEGFSGRTRHIAALKTGDGLAYLRQDSPDVATAIDWLQSSVPGQPVILEAGGESYQHTRSRFSTFSGLPTVVGWPHHCRERGNPPDTRSSEVQLLYTSQNRDKVRKLLAKYQVEYVIVGPTERGLYMQSGGAGFQKFDTWTDLFWPVFQSGLQPPGVTIYRVNPNYALADIEIAEEKISLSLFTPEQGASLLAGREGFLPGQYREPRSLATNPQGQIFVADTFNHRIQGFEANNKLAWTMGEMGDEPGFFREPNDLTVGPDGKLHVLDTWNSRVQVFTATGELDLIFSFSGFGPRGIAVGAIPRAMPLGDRWVASEPLINGPVVTVIANTGQHNLLVFDAKGEKKATWGAGEYDGMPLGEPVDVEITPLGLVVSQGRSNRLMFFDCDGRWLANWTLPFEPVTTMTNEIHLSWDAARQQLWATIPEANKVVALDRSGEVVREQVVEGHPTGIVVTPDGSVYVSLRSQHRIARLTLAAD